MVEMGRRWVGAEAAARPAFGGRLCGPGAAEQRGSRTTRSGLHNGPRFSCEADQSRRPVGRRD